MRKPASAPADGKKMRFGIPRDSTKGLTTKGLTSKGLTTTDVATETVCLALALALLVLASRIASIW